MIKIIEHGTRKIAKCSNCGCKFSYEEEDVIRGPMWKDDSVNCPQCNKAVVIIVERKIVSNE